MGRKNYDEQFRRRAVGLYASTPGATLSSIAADLGVARGSLAKWVDDLGGQHPPGAAPPAARGHVGSQAARIAQLEAENAALRGEQAKLAEERDILRAAAKYFAGETRW